MELRRLCARSATLGERFDGQVAAPIATDEATVQGRLAQWAREVERPDADFTTYLTICGIGENAARRAAHDFEWTGELPAWTARADAVLAAGGQAAARSADGRDVRPADMLAEAIAGEVMRGSPVPLDPEALVEWTRALSERLSSFADPIMATEAWVEQSFGDAPKCLRAFEAARWKSALLRRPALLRAFCVALHHAREAAAEALERLARDRSELRRAFGGDWSRLAKFSAPLSDLHRGGRAVHRLAFEGGAEIFYKPRSLRAEAIFLTAARESYGLPPADPPVVLDRGTHGWMLPLVEAIPASAAEAQRFCTRLGALLSLAHRTGTTDLHRGNVVFTADGPLPVDAETVMHPVLEETWFKLAEGNAFAWVESPLRTHLLGHHLCLEGGERWVPGAFPRPGEPSGQAWENIGFYLGVDWGKWVVAGFRVHEAQAGRSSRGLLYLRRALAGCPRRAVRRDTWIYADVLASSLSDPYVNDGFSRGIRLEGVFRTNDTPLAVLPAERIALAGLDIPALTPKEAGGKAFRLSRRHGTATLARLLAASPRLFPAARRSRRAR